MNICITNIDNKPEFIGGIKRVSIILAREWQRNGHCVFFITHTTSDKRFIEIESIPQFFFPDIEHINSSANKSFFCDFIKKNSIDVIINQFADVKDMVDLCFNIKDLCKISIVTVLHFSPIHKKDITRNSYFISYKLGNKVKQYFYDTLLFCKFWLYKNIKNEKEEGSYYNLIYKNSDLTVLLSEKFKPIFIKKAKLKECSKLIVINNPSLIEIDDKINFIEKEKIVIWCGRLGYDMKRTDKILSIWKKLPPEYNDWQLKILGSGDVDYFKNIIKKYNIHNVDIVGFCNPVEYYKRSSVICMTSVTEGWGMVLVEAASYGCVPIAYNSYESLTDIIEDGKNGYIVKAFDEKEYINKLKDLMDNPLKRAEMAVKGYIHIQKFAVEKIAKQWIDEFEKLLNKK